MALNKRNRLSFRWSKSELPDNDDVNAQVLLLGITRFETTPASSNKLLIDNKAKAQPKDDQSNAFNQNASDITSATSLDQSIEQLNTGCFPLDGKKSSKVLANASTVAAGDLIAASAEPRNIHQINQKSHRNHFDRLFDRFQSKRIQSNLCARQTKHGFVEQKAFYRWLNLNRSKRLERVKCDDQWQTLRTPVIRKCSTKSNNIKKSTKKSTNPSNFTSCVPYCVALSRNNSTGNSLASSYRFAEYRKKRGDASPSSDRHRHRLPTNDCLMHSHCNSNKRCSTSNKNTDSNHNNNCSLFDNLNIMDRSVDSIGSCSLDVDAESTDFSDTSGSLNVCTPLSGKDFTREFTSRIHERCQFPNQLSGQKLQQTKTVLDPNSGKISTILSPNVPAINSPTSPVKKPSYLNLACCVNGYSNLTTYDSKFRQSINKSREVSPIRPITYSLQYNRNGDNNYLSVPAAVPINDNAKNFLMDAHTILSPEKRYFSQTQQKTIEINGSNHEVTDNVNSNGCANFYTRPVLTHSTITTTNGSGNTSLALVRDINQEFDANGKGTGKSFIQQRVERLYGPAAVTQGLYSPKKPKSNDEETSVRTTISSVLVEKSQNSSNTTFQSTKFVLEAQRNGHMNGLSSNRSTHDDENINLDSIKEALPVLRHLRPEFRAQLPTLSPKRTIAISKLNTSSLSTTTQTQTYTNGTSVNSKLNTSTNIQSTATKHMTNGDAVSTNIDEHLTDQSTLYTQLHKQSAKIDAPNDITKNGCLTSNKAHDIEIDTPTNGSNSIVTHLDTENTGSSIDQDINTTNMSSEMSEQTNHFDATQKSAVIYPTIDQTDDASNLATNASTVEPMDANGNHKTDQKKDAHHYLSAVQSERDRLIRLAVLAENELEELVQKGDVDEEVLGHLRSAAGKARLLATKKFKQFEGLCTDSINQIARDMPPPTPGDLQGFWEMVLLQVENVDSMYEDLDKIRADGWKKPIQAKPKQSQGAKLTKRPIPKASTSSTQSAAAAAKKSATALAIAQKREEQRKQLMEMRRKNKMAMTANTTDDIIVEKAPHDPLKPLNDENNTENETDR